MSWQFAAGFADLAIPGIDMLSLPMHMSWSWYQKVPSGWSSGMVKW